MNYNHAPFSSSFFRLIYHRSRPAGGNKRTPNVATYYPRHHNFDGMSSANLRMITGWSVDDQNLFIIDTGNSESLLSGHYDDQMDMMRKGDYIDMSFTRKDELHLLKHKLTIEFNSPTNNTDL